MSPGCLLTVAAFGLATGAFLAARWRHLWLGLTLAGAGAALGAAGLILSGASATWAWRSAFTVGGQALSLELDPLSAFFLALLALIGGVGASYAHQYWSDHDQPASAQRGRRWWSGLLLSMGLVLVNRNGLHFLIGWELFAICSFFLITLDRTRREVRAAGWLYLAASHAGTLCLFAFFTTLSVRTGSWELGPLRDDATLAPLFWLALAGFGVKAGIFPLHVWLPSAHASAPSHVSALLSGVALKLGLYGIVRFSGWLPTPPSAGWMLVLLGSASALFGIAFALAQQDLKRLLAYSSVENVGVILLALGAAVIGFGRGELAWAWLALTGALWHVWNHGLFKSLLFLAAGSVLHATGTREMSRLGGLWATMPWTAACFVLGAAAVSALPPLNGFVSEWLVYLGLFDAVASRGSVAWVALPAILVLAVTGALALATFVKAGAIVFLGAPRTAAARHAHEGGRWIRGPMVLLGAGCLGAGLFPFFVWPLVARAAFAWRETGPAAGAPLAPIATLGSAQLTLAVLGLIVSAGLWHAARTRGLRRELTWDCGYASPTPRMQYTSGSFAAVAAGWFGWLLQPERLLRRPRGLFPAAASSRARVPETVLERFITPAGRVVLQVSTVVRRLQHGRLPFYVLYLVAGLIVLAALVLLGADSP